MKENVVKEKSFAFALKIIKLVDKIQSVKKEFEMRRQLLRSGTSVGASIREAEHAEGKCDFIHKMALDQKEINETIYRIELLNQSNYLSNQEVCTPHSNAIKLIKRITTILKKATQNLRIHQEFITTNY